jgi:ABC-type transport system involved in cytochrome bd biosynthesis fused ATPase/permease subunit
VLATCAPIALAVAIGVLDWISLLIVLVVLALFPIFGALVGRATTSLATARWSEVEGLGRQIVDVFEGLPILKAYNRSTEQRERIREAGQSLTKASLATLKVAFLSGLVLDTLASVSIALLAVPLGLRLLNGSISLAPALAILILAPEVFIPLRRASAEFHESSEGLAAQRAALDRIAITRDRVHRPRTIAAPSPLASSISFRSVEITIPGREEPLLRNASLEIAPGETVALVGPNGTGKSTVIAALLGLIEPANGAITIGGIDLRDIDLEDWRRQITYLPDHPTILPGTLADNLRIANPATTNEELETALRSAGAGEFARKLELELAANVGEDRRALSAGERQQIALARVLCRPASLYLLDEPTVHLDRRSEQMVINALATALEGKSALIVTHRRAPLTLADRIVTIENGDFISIEAQDAPREIVAEGVHS